MAASIFHTRASGGSRICRGGGVDLRRGYFSVKMYAKTKEFSSFGGRRAVSLLFITANFIRENTV